MEIIPVIDILGGKVVHAVGGEREEYEPLQSKLCESCDPLPVALTFQSMGFSTLYVADLDAIRGNSLNSKTYEQLSEATHLSVMIDAGISQMEKARRVLKVMDASLILGTETLRSLKFVKKAVESFGSEKIIVSIDLKQGNVLSKADTIQNRTPVSLANALEDRGVKRVIILNLSRVGTERGLDLDLIQRILQQTTLDVFTGGGIRGIEDLRSIRSLGVSSALIATSLHKGSLKRKTLKTHGFLK